MRLRIILATLLLTSASAVFAEPVKKNFRSQEKFSIAPDGLLVLENPLGEIVIEGADVSQIEATIIRRIAGADDDAVEEGRRQAGIIVGGDGRTRIIRSPSIPPPGAKWQATTDWNIRLPVTASVRILSRVSRQIIVTNLRGSVQVTNFNGNIHLNNTTGRVLADSVNGSMHYNTNKPGDNVVLSSVNGSLIASVGREADVRWIAETVRGDVLSNLPVRGAFFGVGFQGSLNAPEGPTIKMSTLMGNVQLSAFGEAVEAIQSLRKTPATLVVSPPGKGPSQGMARETVQGFFQYATNLGDVRVQEIRGEADIFTGAGEVELGAVSGACKVRSAGGPLQLGEILGPLDAATRAGDILVDSARRGGVIETQGGTIRLFYTGGPTRLESGGGDIIVRQAAAAIDATTKSGDIAIQVDPSERSQKIDAVTSRGSITLNVARKFAADIDATIVTAHPESDTILSDIPGLSVSREDLGGKTRIRATGKINGGGDRVVLRATDGDIRITTAPFAPTVVRRQR